MYPVGSEYNIPAIMSINKLRKHNITIERIHPRFLCLKLIKNIVMPTTTIIVSFIKSVVRVIYCIDKEDYVTSNVEIRSKDVPAVETAGCSLSFLQGGVFIQP